MSSRVGVLGAGAWGSALAQVARTAGHEVHVWSRQYPESQALAGCDGLILAVPAQAAREVLTQLKDVIAGDQPIIIAAKGIEQRSGLFMAELLAQLVPQARAMVLSGPSFAADVIKGLPTAVVLAAPTLAEAGEWAGRLSLPEFRIYASDDVRGVEIGGALKNVLAIACGISDGRGMGDSARAALTTRGFAELVRFSKRLGAKAETMTGLSGLGDLLLTCSSTQSRNYAFGHAIGEGISVADALARSKGVVEGAFTATIAHTLAARYVIDMPIVDAVHAIVDEGGSPDQEIARLLARPAGKEIR